MLIVRLQQISEILIVLLILLDVFLIVLYARMGSGLISPQRARMVSRAFRMVARRFPRYCDRIESFCGPIILVSLVFVWVAGLTLGNGPLFHPVLGTVIRSSSGKTPINFVSAFYAGGSSISTVGSANFSPDVSRYSLVYLFNSIVRLSVTSLTLTYLMQIQSQLQQRNTLALKVYLVTCETGMRRESAIRTSAVGRHKSRRGAVSLKVFGNLTPNDTKRSGEEAGFANLLTCKGCLVDLIGIEPMTSSMPWKRAPSCATGPLLKKNYLYTAARQPLPSIQWNKRTPVRCLRMAE